MLSPILVLNFMLEYYLQFNVLFIYSVSEFNVVVNLKINYYYCTLLLQLNITLNLSCDSAVFSCTPQYTRRKGNNDV